MSDELFNGSSHGDFEEITSALRDIDNNISFLEEFGGQGGEMGILGDLGLGQHINPKGAYMMQNEDIPFPLHTPLSANDQYSPESVVDSVSSSSTIPLERNRASDLLTAVSLNTEETKTKINELASSAMEELVRKAYGGEPLWQHQVDSTIETLNVAEYIREFRAYDATLKEIMQMIQVGDSGLFGNLDGNFYSSDGNQEKIASPHEAEPGDLETEASRAIGFVNMNATSIVELLMDSMQWCSVFSKIVSRGAVLGVLSCGKAGSYDETLQVMKAEYQMGTPLVPIRECQFARYCKELDSNTWAIVDVSLENLFPYPESRFQRRPSGCLIQQYPDGFSKITWVEHVEADLTKVHVTFRSIVQSGLTFGAKRWVETLIHHSEWITTLMSQHCPPIHQGLITLNGKESVLRLSERMMRRFCGDLSASSDNIWMPFPDHEAQDHLRLMTKRFTTTLGSSKASIAFTSSFWLPASPDRLFDFLRFAEFRSKWDLLSRRLMIEEVMHIMIGENRANRISIMQAKRDGEQVEIMYLQETYRDIAASYVVYAPVDVQSMSSLLNGQNPDKMNILPSGFVIHSHHNHKNNNQGTILTLSYHILDTLSTEDNIAPQTIQTAYRILRQTSDLIKAAVSSDYP